jgi:hypothetical protein
MTTHTTTRTGRPVTERAAGHYITRDHTVVGTPAQLANLIANHRNAGTFVLASTPCPLTGGRFQTVIRLREPVPAPPTIRFTSVGDHARARMRARRSRRTRIGVIVAAITGTVAGLLAVAAYLLGQLVELITAHAGPILGVLVLAAILAAVAARGGSGRRHCPGC